MSWGGEQREWFWPTFQRARLLSERSDINQLPRTVDGRIVIVVLSQIHIVGVRVLFQRFHRHLVLLWS